MENGKPLSTYNVQEGSVLHLVHRPPNFVGWYKNSEAAAPLKSDRNTYEKTAREWTRLYAWNPVYMHVVILHISACGENVECVSGSGDHLLDQPSDNQLAAIRKAVCEKMNIGPRGLTLMHVDGSVLDASQDGEVVSALLKRT